MKNYQIDGNKEMVALGSMNIIGSFTSCYVATGSFSRSAVKDMHIFSAAETSRSASKGEEDMESKYAALEEEVRIKKEKVKQGDKKYEKLVQFMISKFPDSQNILCPPDKDGIPTHDDIADLSDNE